MEVKQITLLRLDNNPFKENMDAKVSWRILIEEVLKHTGENFSDLELTLSEEELDEEFDDDHGEVTSRPFTAWGKDFVYFPLEYDGAESVGYAPRNPGITMKHQGSYLGKDRAII